MAAQRMFPLQSEDTGPAGPSSIPWEIAERAYQEYNRRYPGQTLERIAERSGFGWLEMDEFLPGWRDEVDLFTKLTTRVAELEETNSILRQDNRSLAEETRRCGGRVEGELRQRRPKVHLPGEGEGK